MYSYGGGSGYGGWGCPSYCPPTFGYSGGYGSSTAIILVLFILLVIVICPRFIKC
jgi:uncharacterized protein (TIGR01732 family)